MDILRQAGRAVKGIGSTVTGGVEHAVIAIVDQRDEEVTEEDNTISSLPDLISKGTKGVTDKLKQFANEHAPVLSSMVDTMMNGVNYGENVKKYTVQFNPETLKLSAGINEEATKKSVDKDKGQVEYTSQGARYTLSVMLIFDESDAVMAPEHSVSKQMEGFISAISNPATSNIIFSWGNMSYEGYLESIDGKYVMFSKEGMPIRGQAELSIICTGIFGESQISQNNPSGMWKGAYEDIITDSKSEKGTGLFEFMK